MQEDVVGPAQAAMTASLAQGSPASLQGAFAMAAIMEGMGTPIPVIRGAGPQVEIQTLVGSIIYALGFHVRGFQDLLDRTHGHSPFDNTATVYTGALPAQLLAAVNASVDRFATTPDAQGYLQRYFDPSGELTVPVVTLHNAFDPVAPLFHQALYRTRVAGAGRSGLLTQRISANPYGHCALSVDETMAAFANLRERVN